MNLVFKISKILICIINKSSKDKVRLFFYINGNKLYFENIFDEIKDLM